MTPGPEVHLDWAEPADAGGAVDASGADTVRGRSAAAWRAMARDALGVDGGGPLVMSGHQAGPWHPGILAKYAALRGFAAGGARTADVLVEHEVADPLVVAVPLRGVAGGLHMGRAVFGDCPEGRPMMSVPPIRPRTPSLEALAVPAAERLEAWGLALEAAADRHPNLAAQVRGALADVLPETAAPPAAWWGSAAMLRIPLGRELVAAMVEDPWRCAEAYARAARSVPEAGIPPLHVRDDFVELPLWRITPEGRRLRADDSHAAAWLAGGPDAPVLAPRAVLLTAIIRLGLADLFIHGRGGAVYDRMMRRWIDGWLGVRPAPAIVATADLRLPLGVGRATAAAAGRWPAAAVAAHRTWHDPEALDELEEAITERPGPVKRDLLAAIDRVPRGSAERRRLWRAMHRQLEVLRGVHVGRVESAERRAAGAGRAAGTLAVARRRDWFALLHEPPALEAMAEAVRRHPVPQAAAAMLGTRVSGGHATRSAPSADPWIATGEAGPAARSARSAGPPA